MAAQTAAELAQEIAERLLELRELASQKALAQNRVKDLKEEIDGNLEQINTIEQKVRSIKHEITDRLVQSEVELRVVGE